MRMDKNNDGAIAPQEQKAVIATLLQQITEKELLYNMIINANGITGDDNLYFADFFNMFKEREFSNKWELLVWCYVMDKDGSGKISAKEIKQGMKNFGEWVTDNDVAEMIKKASRDGDGLIDYEEFVENWQSWQKEPWTI